MYKHVISATPHSLPRIPSTSLPTAYVPLLGKIAMMEHFIPPNKKKESVPSFRPTILTLIAAAMAPNIPAADNSMKFV